MAFEDLLVGNYDDVKVAANRIWPSSPPQLGASGSARSVTRIVYRINLIRFSVHETPVVDYQGRAAISRSAVSRARAVPVEADAMSLRKTLCSAMATTA